MRGNINDLLIDLIDKYCNSKEDVVETCIYDDYDEEKSNNEESSDISIDSSELTPTVDDESVPHVSTDVDSSISDDLNSSIDTSNSDNNSVSASSNSSDSFVDKLIGTNDNMSLQEMLEAKNNKKNKQSKKDKKKAKEKNKNIKNEVINPSPTPMTSDTEDINPPPTSVTSTNKDINSIEPSINSSNNDAIIDEIREFLNIEDAVKEDTKNNNDTLEAGIEDTSNSENLSSEKYDINNDTTNKFSPSDFSNTLENCDDIDIVTEFSKCNKVSEALSIVKILKKYGYSINPLDDVGGCVITECIYTIESLAEKDNINITVSEHISDYVDDLMVDCKIKLTEIINDFCTDKYNVYVGALLELASLCD